MAKRFRANKIKRHRVYTIWEVSDLLGCHKQTVSRWIKYGGLNADTSQRPWLISGDDLKRFLGARLQRARCRLALHHCFCLGCKAPREPDGKIADYFQQTVESGRLTALCPACGALMNKVVRRSDLEAIRAKIEVTVQKVTPRLVSRSQAHSNATLDEEHQSHAKAQQ